MHETVGRAAATSKIFHARADREVRKNTHAGLHELEALMTPREPPQIHDAPVATTYYWEGEGRRGRCRPQPYAPHSAFKIKGFVGRYVLQKPGAAGTRDLDPGTWINEVHAQFLSLLLCMSGLQERLREVAYDAFPDWEGCKGQAYIHRTNAKSRRSSI